MLSLLGTDVYYTDFVNIFMHLYDDVSSTKHVFHAEMALGSQITGMVELINLTSPCDLVLCNAVMLAHRRCDQCCICSFAGKDYWQCKPVKPDHMYEACREV